MTQYKGSKGPKSDTGLPENLLKQRYEIPEETLKGAIERHPLAWLTMTAKKAEEDRI